MVWIYWDTFRSLFQRRLVHEPTGSADAVNFHIDPMTIEQPYEQMEHA